jgi:hypothetical protein
MSPAISPVRKPGLFERLWRRDPSQPKAATSAPGRPGLVRIVDWRLVAAVGLPLWTFLIGFIVAHKPAPPAPEPVTVAAITGPNGQMELPPAPPPVESIPAPREVVIRTEVVTVPVAVPVLASCDPVAAAPAEFTLPPSEVMPADRCKTFDTKVRFHAGLPEAAEEAKQSKKMLLVLHISGNFDDPGFT